MSSMVVRLTTFRCICGVSGSAGIQFKDVTTLLLDPKAFQLTTDFLVQRYQDQKVDAVVGFEARGFIFGPPLVRTGPVIIA